MNRRVAIATAAPLLAVWGCIWPEPVTETPPPADSAPSILEAIPNIHQVTVQESNDGSCVVSVGLNDVLAPQGQPLFAQFSLNFNQNPTLPTGTPIPVGGSTVLDLQQQQSNTTQYLLPQYQLPLSDDAQALFPIDASDNGANGPANVLTVFVSDGFDPNDPSQPIDSSHYVTSWDWQVVVTDPYCIAQLDNLIP